MQTNSHTESSSHAIQQLESLTNISGGRSDANNLCDVESSLCIEELNLATRVLDRKLLVSDAMRTRYVTVLMSTLLTEAVTLMLAEKQSCAIMVDSNNLVIRLLTLADIQEFSENAKYQNLELKVRKFLGICDFISLKHLLYCSEPKGREQIC